MVKFISTYLIKTWTVDRKIISTFLREFGRAENSDDGIRSGLLIYFHLDNFKGNLRKTERKRGELGNFLLDIFKRNCATGN